MPELKPYHSAVLKTHQFGKQIADLHFELELPGIAEFRPVALVAVVLQLAESRLIG